MKLKRMVSVAICSCMAAGLLLGCAGEGTEENTKKNGTGKYQEEGIAVPLQENETMLRLCKDPKGTLVLYTENQAEEKFYQYKSKDGKEWKSEEASWLGAIQKGFIGSIAAGQDGNEYAIVITEDTETRMHLLKKTALGEAEEIDIPDLNKEDGVFTGFSTEIAVLENGNLVLIGHEEVRVYDASGGNKLYSFKLGKKEGAACRLLGANGNKIVMPDQEYKGFVVRDGEKEEAVLPYGSGTLGGRVVLDKENDVYFLDAQGIHHMQPEGTLVETLCDGSGMMMGTPEVRIQDFVKGNGDDFYALYKTKDNQMVIKYYYYNEKAEIGNEKKLTIYSLREMERVRLAIAGLNQEHQDVEVVYRTGESDGATTRADQIRVLNTELMNKNGADVLILDGLPIESFIEKGILQDISGILNPLIEDGTLQQNIAECYKDKDGKIYGMPVRYGVPILYGTQSRIDAMQTIDTLEQWLAEHPDIPLMTKVSYERLTKLLVSMYYEALFGKDGKLEEEALKRCLTIVEKAEESIQGEIDDPSSVLIDETGTRELETSWWEGGYDDMIFKGEEGIAAREIRNVVSMGMPYAVIREQNLVPVFNKDKFIPHIIAGINSETKEQELAEEFIRILFSENMQKQEFRHEDGLPMNVKAAEKMIEAGAEREKKQAEIKEGMSNPAEIYGITPSKNELKYLFDGAGKLKKPAEADSLLLDMIFEEARLYYEGSKNLEEAVQGIKAKVDTYRAE